MIASLRAQLARLPLRSKLVGLYLFFGILPVMLLAGAFYQLSRNILLDKATENLQAITAKNNELVESQLRRIEEAALMLTVDQQLHSLLNPAQTPGNLEILHGSREIKKILDRYFMGISGIFACHMYTDCYMMVGISQIPRFPTPCPACTCPMRSLRSRSCAAQRRRREESSCGIPPMPTKACTAWRNTRALTTIIPISFLR